MNIATWSRRLSWKLVLAGTCLVFTQCSSRDAGSPSEATGETLTTPFVLWVSSSASRSSPEALGGATLSGVAYVYTSDASKSSMPAGIKQVRYWLDDPQMSGSPIHVENYAPYDFVGTATNGTGEAWDTSTLAKGTHSITQSVTATAGTVTSATASFTAGGASCTPTTCAAQGKNCGSIPNGCGGTLACGSCTSPETCGGAGTQNVCGAPNVNHYYVATNGKDTNDGSSGSPWATINHADTALSLGPNGAIVHVAPGTYATQNTTKHSGTATQPVRFQSDVRWGAKITAFWSIHGAYQEIVGFEMTGPGEGGMIACYTSTNYGGTPGHHCRILGNYIHDVGTSQCSSAGAVNTSVVAGNGEPLTDEARGYNEVIGNVIRHVGADAGAPNHCNQFHGIYLSGPHDVAQNNIISGVIGWGIHARGDTIAQVITNNTIFNNSHGGIITDATGPNYPVYDYATIANNVLANNGLAGGSPAYGIDQYNGTLGTHNLFSNNLLYGNLPSNWGKGVTSTGGSPSCADPCDDKHMQTGTDATVFVSYESDWNTAPASSYSASHYELRTGSAAIDHGTTSCTPGGTTPCVPSVDFLGGQRPVNAVFDIGAFESSAQAATWPWF